MTLKLNDMEEKPQNSSFLFQRALKQQLLDFFVFKFY